MTSGSYIEDAHRQMQRLATNGQVRRVAQNCVEVDAGSGRPASRAVLAMYAFPLGQDSRRLVA